jgi:hypothetical protein
MAFANGLSERMGELRFPNPKSPNDDTTFSGYISPPRGQSQYIPPYHSSSTDTRANLQRRFTTDSSKISAVPGMGGQNSQFVKSHFTASVRGAELLVNCCDPLSLPLSFSLSLPLFFLSFAVPYYSCCSPFPVGKLVALPEDGTFHSYPRSRHRKGMLPLSNSLFSFRMEIRHFLSIVLESN